MQSNKTHAAEAELLKFLERRSNTSFYVFRVVQWLKEKYPDSHAKLLPKLRKIYKEKLSDEARQHR
jgi:hypothetical protein